MYIKELNKLICSVSFPNFSSYICIHIPKQVLSIKYKVDKTVLLNQNLNHETINKILNKK